MIRRRVLIGILQTLAVLGYAACVIEWGVVLMLYAPSVMQSSVFRTFVTGDGDTAAVASPTLDLPPGAALVFAALVSAIVIVVAIVSIVKTPRALGESGSRATKQSAELVLPTITRHKNISQAQHRRLSTRLVLGIKLAVIMVPILLVLVAPEPSYAASRDILLLICAVSASIATISFGVQYALARARRVPMTQLW